MNSNTINKKNWNDLFQIIRCGLSEMERPQIEGTPDWKSLYRMAERHKIEEIVYFGIQKLPSEIQPPTEIMEKFSQAYNLGVARDTTQYFAFEELTEAFEAEGIYFVPLKGIWMKQFYPSPELRMMADFDILFQMEQKKEVDRVLRSKGYEADHVGGNHHVYFRKPFMNIEMHSSLLQSNSKYAFYYENEWEKAYPEEGKKYFHRFPWEDYYIFMIVHMVKHFRNSGCGIRLILDTWLFNQKMRDSLNLDYLAKELEILHLTAFEKHMRKLASVCFGDEPSTEFYDDLTEYMIGSGVYGTVENGKIRDVIEHNKSRKSIWYGKFLVLLSKIFLPYENMAPQYPYLKKFPWLLPLAWIQRILRTCLKRREQIAPVLASANVDKEKSLKNQEIFYKLEI